MILMGTRWRTIRCLYISEKALLMRRQIWSSIDPGSCETVRSTDSDGWSTGATQQTPLPVTIHTSHGRLTGKEHYLRKRNVEQFS